MFDRYTALMGNGQVRDLMAVVVQDAHNETLDFANSCVSIEKHVRSEISVLGTPRREIIGFFNAMWFSGLETLPNAFWWEMRYRLLKLITISITLEALNLKLMLGCTHANNRDIPQALVFIKERLDAFTDKSAAVVSAAFDDSCRKQSDLCEAYLRHFSQE